MLKFFTKRRFNYVDLISLLLLIYAADIVSLWFLLLIPVALLLSGILEDVAKNHTGF